MVKPPVAGRPLGDPGVRCSLRKHFSRKAETHSDMCNEVKASGRFFSLTKARMASDSFSSG